MQATQVIVDDGEFRRLVDVTPGRASALALAAGYLMAGMMVVLRTTGALDTVLRVNGGQVVCSYGK